MVLYPLIKDLSLAQEDVAIPAGSFRPSGDGQINGVYISL